MTIQHGTTRGGMDYYAKPAGYDLRSTAVGGAIRYGSPEAVANFKRILARGSEPSPAKESKPMGNNGVVTAMAVEPEPPIELAKYLELTDDEVRIAFAEYSDGESLSQIGERYGVEGFTLFTKFRELGLVQRKTGPFRDRKGEKTPLTDDQVRQAHAEYWNSNESMEAVGKRLGVTGSALSSRFKKLDLPTRSVYSKDRKGLEEPVMPEFSDDDIRRIYRDYIDSGDSISVIGRRHGIDKTTLHRRFKGLDLPRRTRQGEMPKTAVPDPDPITVELASDRRQTIGYDLMRGLLLLLPEDARWTTAERDKHLAAYVAVLDLVTEVVE